METKNKQESNKESFADVERRAFNAFLTEMARRAARLLPEGESQDKYMFMTDIMELSDLRESFMGSINGPADIDGLDYDKVKAARPAVMACIEALKTFVQEEG